MAQPKARQGNLKRPLPHLAVAVFCEEILEEKNGLSSIIRMLDVISVKPPPTQAPEVGGKAQKPAVPALIFLAFKSGDAKGEYDVHIEMVLPDGKRERLAGSSLNFPGGGFGMNIKAKVIAPIAEEGLVWYDVLVDGVLVTRMPLEVRHEQTETPEVRAPRSNPKKKK